MNFYNNLQNTIDNVSITENGAVGYKTTGSDLVDVFFKVSSFRNFNDDQVREEFAKVFDSQEEYALKFLMYIRDFRSNGLGERRAFRLGIKKLLSYDFEGKDEFFNNLITKFIPKFGRYDDLFVLVDSIYEPALIEFLKIQLTTDLYNMRNNKPISLLAKWMPSANATNPETRLLGKFLAKQIGLSEKDYRKTLSSLRKYLDVVERKMCAKEWGDINYNTVPSAANVKYKEAFLRNDEERRRDYLADLRSGVDKDGNEVKINSKANLPHTIVHSYMKDMRYSKINYDEALEQLWKNLKEVPGLKDTIVVRDDSGSMCTNVGNTKVSAYEVATALAIYCAEHNSPAYKDKLITFSETPRYLDFSSSHYSSLAKKLNFLNDHCEIANTNIMSVFDLILKTAVDHSLTQEELPKQILILSDMEFDSAVSYSQKDLDSLFSVITKKWNLYGYDIPKLVFWNLASRTGTIPCKTNKQGVLFVSGFSQNVLSMVSNGEVDPYKSIIRELDNEAYKDIPLFKPLSKEKEENIGDYVSPFEK